MSVTKPFEEVSVAKPFEEVSIIKQPHREFSGIVSLVSKENMWTREEVLVICNHYMTNQVQPLNIIISEIQDIFYKLDGNIVTETCLRIYGEIANKINYSLTDDEVLDKLISFFTYLGKTMGLISVRFSYQHQSYRINTSE